jgi:ribosomal protein L10
MSKKIKEMELNALRQTFQGVKDFVLLEPIKLDSGAEYEMRKKLRGQKIRVKLVKNTFAKKVLAENGVALENVWSGPTMLCWGADSVKALANSVETAVKETKKDPKAPDKIKVKTAVADGEAITLEVAKTIPTRAEAIGELVSAILAPGANLAAALAGPGAQIAGILKAIEEKKPEAAPAAG